MRYFVLLREQWVPQPPEEVFPFFAEAANLEALTPPWLRFRILTPLPIRMGPGVRIEYRLRLRGLPLRWVAEIRVWEPPHKFVDVQLRGPYRFWIHSHRFIPERGGTRIVDVVRYALPGGILGRWVHRWLVRKDVEKIFRYRAQRIRLRFGLLRRIQYR